ncbi:H-2 class II histocompatibility antigen, E-S beta chain-like [Cyprinodon tularosa]|uniref:H-2 class II histocompatibility antigen, E-S beta chain-like n=1 Tax=Cyprinodon tularosa TaxID=77115 RepID=UPI0018E26759|nr:H-2 class II histocompatibility antigen, E-S beta chain-like [Cyprinodon tularosa]
MHLKNVFIFLQLWFSAEGAYYGYYLGHCQFNFHDSQGVVFLEQLFFNKCLLVQYNSTLGKVVGYTKEGIIFADILNKNPRFQKHQIWKTNRCNDIAHLLYGNLSTVEPYVTLSSVKAEYSQHQLMLICSIYDFYPKKIKVTWLRDGKEITSDVTSTDELPNGNWLYQYHSNLEFTPKPGEKISCMVEHASLREPKIYNWEPEHHSDKKELVIGTAGLLIGLLFSVAGFLYYRRTVIVRERVSTTEDIYPENNL